MHSFSCRALTSSVGRGVFGHSGGGQGQGGVPGGNNRGTTNIAVGGAWNAGISEGVREKGGEGEEEGYFYQVGVLCTNLVFYSGHGRGED